MTEKQTLGGTTRIFFQQLPYNAREIELGGPYRGPMVQPPLQTRLSMATDQTLTTAKDGDFTTSEAPVPLSTPQVFLKLIFKAINIFIYSNTISTASQVHVINTSF